MIKRATPNTLATALRGFFSDYLPRLRGMSPHTTLSYRDTFTLLLRFISKAQGRPVYLLDLEAIDPPAVFAFLGYLEKERGNAISTRNVRLAALHAFFRYVANQYPEQMDLSQRVLGIPFKRTRSRQIEYLEFEELNSVLSGIDRSSAHGRRDYVLLALMFNTGARVQELLNLRPNDVSLSKPFQVRLLGKGRKERICPIWPKTAYLLRRFCSEQQLDLRPDAPIFQNYRGESLTRFGVRYILSKHLDRARTITPSLAPKRLHPHSVRHSTAVHLLKSGVDLCTVSQWLGHASINTTNKYAEVDLEMKRQAISRAKTLVDSRKCQTAWRRDTSILEWLESL